MHKYFSYLALVFFHCLSFYHSHGQTVVADTVVWSGSQNSDWNNLNNWVAGKKPTRLSTVHIPAGTIHQPNFSIDSIVVANLRTEPGTLLDVSSGVLTVAGASLLKGNVKVSQSARLYTAGNELIFYNHKATEVQRAAFESQEIVGSIKYNERDLTFDFFGTKNTVGEILQITSACLYKSNEKDTVFNFTFDKASNVRTLYSSIHGKKDSSLFKLYYQDSVVIINRFRIDWSTKNVILRETMVLDKFSLAKVSRNVYRAANTDNCPLPDRRLRMRLAGDAIIAALGGAIIAWGGSAVVVGVGLAAVLFAGYDVYTLGKDALKGVSDLLGFFLNSACGSELPKPPIVLADPKNEIVGIVSPVYRRCYFSHTFRQQMSCCKPLDASIPGFVTASNHQGPYTTCEGITYPPGAGFQNTWTFWTAEGQGAHIGYSAGKNCQYILYQFRCESSED